MKITFNAYFLFLSIVFIWSCQNLNGPVEILSLSVSDSTVEAGDRILLKCVAKDQESDPLAYSWETSSGIIMAMKDSAIWTAPIENGIYFISCRVTDNYGSSDIATVAIDVSPSNPVPVTGLDWTISDNGLLNGSNSSNVNKTGESGFWDGSQNNADFGWNITEQEKTENSITQSLQFKIEDSANCNGDNSNVQRGKATANIQVTGSDPITLEIDFSGFGEAEASDYELIEFKLDGIVIGDGHAPGGGLGCSSAPVIVNPSDPKLLDPGPHTLIIKFTTNDNLFHQNAYYKITLKLTAY